MDFRSLVPILLTLASVNADALTEEGFKKCSVGVDQCHADFKEKVRTHTSDTNAMCGDMNALMKCIFSQGCPVEESQLSEMRENAQKAVNKLGCSSVEGYSSPGSVALPTNILLIAMISSIFLFLKDYIA